MLGNILERIRTLVSGLGAGSGPKMGRPLKVGQANDLFEVVSREEIRIKGGVSVTPMQNQEGQMTALMLNNGSGGALICVCPRGYEGSCKPMVIDSGLATCDGRCSHSEIIDSTGCLWSWVSGTSFADWQFTQI